MIIIKTIFINGKFLCQKITGVQRFAIEIVKELDKIEQNDIVFKIIAPSKEFQINSLSLKNIEIIYTKGKPGYYWEQFKLSKYCKKNRPGDLINFCNIAPIKYPGSCVIHDLAFVDAPSGLSWKMKLVYKFIFKKNIKIYKHIFTVSKTTKDRIIEHYKYKNPDNITIIYPSADHIRSIQPQIPKIDLPEKFYFSLGSMNPNKNFGAIIKLAKENPNKYFIISGKAHKTFNNKSLESLPNLIFVGYLSDEEIVYLYKNCEAFLFPSLFEGFGLPPLEAIIAGCKCIVCNDIPVLREIYSGICQFSDFNTIDLDDLKKEEVHYPTQYSWKETAKKLFESLK